jgi:hypothetical protein
MKSLDNSIFPNYSPGCTSFCLQYDVIPVDRQYRLILTTDSAVEPKFRIYHLNFYRLKDDIHATDHRRLGNVLQKNAIVDAGMFTSSRLYISEYGHSVEAVKGPCFDFCLAAFDVPVVSKRLGDRLSSVAKDEIQLIPVTVWDDASYYILNTLRQLSCLDESRSLFTKWQVADGRPDRNGQYRMVVELKVAGPLIGKSNIFRIEGWYVPLVVSESIRQIFLDTNISDGVFEPIS